MGWPVMFLDEGGDILVLRCLGDGLDRGLFIGWLVGRLGGLFESGYEGVEVFCYWFRAFLLLLLGDEA